MTIFLSTPKVKSSFSSHLTVAESISHRGDMLGTVEVNLCQWGQSCTYMRSSFNGQSIHCFMLDTQLCCCCCFAYHSVDTFNIPLENCLHQQCITLDHMTQLHQLLPLDNREQRLLGTRQQMTRLQTKSFVFCFL